MRDIGARHNRNDRPGRSRKHRDRSSARDTPCFERLMASLAGSKSAIYCIYNLFAFRSSRAGVSCDHPLKTAFGPAAISAETIREETYDLRNPCLPLCAGPAAGAIEALRDDHAEAVGEALHEAG